MMSMIIFLLFIFITSHHTFAEDCIDCSVDMTNTCSPQWLEIKRRELKREKLILELEVKSDPIGVDESIFSNYLSKINEIRACEKTLSSPLTACSLRYGFDTTIKNRFQANYDMSFTSEKDGNCVYKKFNFFAVYGPSGDKIFQYLNGRYNFDNKHECSVSFDGNTYSTSRNFTLNVADSSPELLVIDWFTGPTEINNPAQVINETRTSQNWGKRIDFPRNVSMDVTYGENINFNFSNEHQIVFNERGEIIHSTILPANHFNSSCETNVIKRGSSSKPYFSPRLNPLPGASSYPISRVTN